jgi:thiamine pyrophosphate-dependent acetolactate synthase large subunit-like protein
MIGFVTVAEAPGCPGRRVERATEPAGASPDALGHEDPFIPEIPLAAGEPSAHDSTAR